MNPPPFLRPSPRDATGAVPVDAHRDPRRAAERLLEGDTLVVSDRYGTGAEILHALAHQLGPPSPGAPFAARRAFELEHREAARRLLAPVVDHEVALQGARSSGFLAELYPELRRLHLPLVDLQELQGAWERYTEGQELAVLGARLHPFYGTYVPTRTEHLELFGTWLSRWQGARRAAVDVGTGCGVLALMLCKAGLEAVLATDSSPNAVESLRRDLERLAPPELPIALRTGDLLCGTRRPADLVVFNPPWTRGRVASLVDRALVYEDPALFERFFDQALEALAPEGRVVMLFSNIASLLTPEEPHPIEVELARGRLRLVDRLQRRVKGRGGRKTREQVEVWELARA